MRAWIWVVCVVACAWLGVTAYRLAGALDQLESAIAFAARTRPIRAPTITVENAQRTIDAAPSEESAGWSAAAVAWPAGTVAIPQPTFDDGLSQAEILRLLEQEPEFQRAYAELLNEVDPAVTSAARQFRNEFGE